MSIWQCNSCGQIYPDAESSPDTLPHVCHPDVIEYAVFNSDGTVKTPERRTARENIRNENLLPSLTYWEGVPKLRVPDPTRNVPTILVDAESVIISEGKGRTKVE